MHGSMFEADRALQCLLSKEVCLMMNDRRLTKGCKRLSVIKFIASFVTKIKSNPKSKKSERNQSQMQIFLHESQDLLYN